jgi:hypothetical protein
MRGEKKYLQNFGEEIIGNLPFEREKEMEDNIKIDVNRQTVRMGGGTDCLRIMFNDRIL